MTGQFVLALPRFAAMRPLFTRLVFSCALLFGAPAPSPGSTSPGAPAASAAYPLAPFEVSRPYDPPAQDWLAGHRGIDLRARAGQSLYSPADARVHFSGWVVNRGVLTLQLGNGDLLSFEPVDAVVQGGDAVRAGQVLGRVSDPARQPHSGDSTETADWQHCESGFCLHIGLRRNNRYLNPLLLWPELRPPIVLLRPV